MPLGETTQTRETQLVFRRNINNKWLWLLQSPDRHVVNRSEVDFATKNECVVDARRNGFSLTD